VQRLPGGADPAEAVERSDEVSFALLVVMERLTPEQRVARVLHDAFGVPFDEIAATLATTPESARQHASRARRAVTAEGTPRHTADLAEQRRVLTAFAAAANSGDLEALVAVLAPDVVAIGDGGGVAPAGQRPVVGADRVARLLLGLFATYRERATWVELAPALVNGDLGVIVGFGLPDGAQIWGTMAFAIADGRVTGVFNQLNPAKLRLPPGA
jgi:RNA polymerase sigma-70 factor (ECF subfamily)